jgi:hypothetical protein
MAVHHRVTQPGHAVFGVSGHWAEPDVIDLRSAIGQLFMADHDRGHRDADARLSDLLELRSTACDVLNCQKLVVARRASRSR